MRILNFTLLATLLLLSCNPKGQSRFQNNVDWQSFLAEQNLKWDTLTGYFYAGPMSGNGLIGAVIHKMEANRFDGDTNKILFEINRTEVIDSCGIQKEGGYAWSRLPIGRFELKPKGIIQSSNWEIDIWNARVNGTVKTDQGIIHIEHYTHATRPVFITELTIEGDEAPQWHFFADETGCIKDMGNVDFQESATYSELPDPAVAVQDNIHTHRQELTCDRTFTVGWTQQDSGNKMIHYGTIAYSDPVKYRHFDAADELQNISKIDLKELKMRHQQWWHDFYQQCFISIPDKELEQFWWMQQYKIGSTMREDLQMMDLMGPWYANTPWRAIWWNWNTQAMYSPHYSCNRTEINKPLFRALQEHKEKLRQNVPEKYRNHTMGIGHTSSFYLYSPLNLSEEAYWGREPGNMTWVMHNYYLQYLYTMDTAMLRNEIFPMLKEAVNLYLKFMEEGDDGKLHLPWTVSPEYGVAEDCTYDLSLFRWGCKTLLETDKMLKINDPLRPKWQDVMNRLVDYHVNENGYMIGKDVPYERSHRHFSHLMMIYPLQTIDFDDPEQLALAKKSINHWLSLDDALQPWSYSIAAGMYACMNDGNKALKQLKTFLPGLTYNTMYREAGMCSETPYSAVKSMNEMLLQSHKGYIEVFPSVPDNWQDITFHDLRARGGFLVSAERKDGKTKFIKIKSLTGAPCYIKCDIDPEIINIQNIDKSGWSISKSMFRIDLKKGEEVYLSD